MRVLPHLDPAPIIEANVEWGSLAYLNTLEACKHQVFITHAMSKVLHHQ